jgi:hypothetical protein
LYFLYLSQINLIDGLIPVLGIELSISHFLGRHFTTLLTPQSCIYFLLSSFFGQYWGLYT